MSQQLIERARTELPQYHNLLDALSEADLSNMKNTEGRQQVKEVRGMLSAGRKKVTAANQNLDTVKETRQKRAAPKENNEPNKKKREETLHVVVFGSVEFLDDLKTRLSDGSYDIDAFLEKMMATSGPTRKGILAVGLALVMHGVNKATVEEYTESLESFKHSELLKKALSLPASDINQLTKDDLASLYLGTSPAQGGDPITVHNLTNLVQHVQESLGTLRFIINWNSLSKKDDAELAKNEVLSTIFRKKFGLEEGTMVDKDSNHWRLFTSQAKDYRRGAMRLLLAYRKLGSLVIICPHFSFRYFHDSSLGQALTDIVKELGTVFEEHSRIFKEREVAHRLLLRTILGMFSKGNTLVGVVDDLERSSTLRTELAPLASILKTFAPACSSDSTNNYADLTGELGELASQIDALPFFECFIREALRLHPSVQSTLRVAAHDDIIPVSEPARVGERGEVLRVGRRCPDRLAWWRGWDPKGRGEDAHEFNPDRWNKLPETAKTTPGLYANLMNWSIGPHSCPASRWALVEIKTMLAVLVASFDFSGASPMNGHNFLVVRPYVDNQFSKGHRMPLVMTPL
ncbi:hypothetical protein FRC12_002141 [Ceratobasidium sp. 428]|nr:hypothetical protein FRC12_002141 [Ceratobasidium sp. 428]